MHQLILPINAEADNAIWYGCAAVSLWIAWQIYSSYSTHRLRRNRHSRVESLAKILGLKYETDHKSAAYEELSDAYSDALWFGQGLFHERPRLGARSGGWGIRHLHHAQALTAFEIGSWSPPCDGIAIGVQIDNLAVPPFHRYQSHSPLIKQFAEAMRPDQILGLPDGSFVFLRDVRASDAIRALFSPSLMSFLTSNRSFDLAGNGNQLWLSCVDEPFGENVETIFLQGVRLLRQVLIPVQPPS